jgi:hypothetical protein
VVDVFAPVLAIYSGQVAGMAFEEDVQVGGAGVAAGEDGEDPALWGEDRESAALLGEQRGWWGHRHSHSVVFVVWAFRVDYRNSLLEQVLVELVLAPVDGAGLVLMALSVGPRWVARPVTVSRTPNVGPEITFNDVGVWLGSATPGQTPADPATMIRACGQRVGKPSWWLAAVPATPNGGDHDVGFIVQRVPGLFVPVVVWVQPVPRCRSLPRLCSESLPPVMFAGRL